MSIRYFVRANSSEGNVNFAENNLQGIQKVYLIKSEFDYLKSAFNWIKRNYQTINLVSGGFLILVGILMATGMLGRLLTLLS